MSVVIMMLYVFAFGIRIAVVFIAEAISATTQVIIIIVEID